MALPPELHLDKTERLRAHQAAGAEESEAPLATAAPEAPAEPEAPEEGEAPQAPEAPEAPESPAAPPPPVRRGEVDEGAPPSERGRPQLGRMGRRLARRLLGERVSHELRVHLVEPRGMADAALEQVASLDKRVQVVEARWPRVEDVVTAVHAHTVNLELMKGEVRAVVEALDELGMAIAPAAGLAGAGARLSELRERVNGLDRRLRVLASPPPSRDGDPAAEAARSGAGRPEDGRRASTALFDYVGFERRFRGDPAVIAAQLSERYLEQLAAHPPVLDIGCGNAGLVEALVAGGVEAIGIDSDPSMVAEARDRGLDVRLVDAVTFLRDREPGSLGAVIATHLVEHLELAELVELLELSASRLAPGGLFITETPNPASLIVLGNSYVLDPTHVRPMHPSLLTFLCEGAGFRDVRLHFYSPATDYQLPLIDDPAAPEWAKQVNEAFGKLNNVLFGPQDYALIATTPSE